MYQIYFEHRLLHLEYDRDCCFIPKEVIINKNIFFYGLKKKKKTNNKGIPFFNYAIGIHIRIA